MECLRLGDGVIEAIAPRAHRDDDAGVAGETGNLTLRAYTELVRLYLQVLRETTNWLADDSRKSTRSEDSSPR
jgi:hypothetical protein